MFTLIAKYYFEEKKKPIFHYGGSKLSTFFNYAILKY